jgi:RNA polymerase sigma factor (sigma-70 family)
MVWRSTLPLLNQLRRLFDAETSSHLSDGQLLQCFQSGRDEEAFTALMHRHGPMVHRVCRRVLAREHDAEDVFQATFLVLARKAGSIAKSASVASWLHGVAYRLALKARLQSGRWHARAASAVPPETEEPSAATAWRELQAILDEELQRLPAKYRAPLILCYLEDLTHDEAALQLGWPVGTVKGRLARAREMLRCRLAKRGLALTATAWVAALAGNGVSAAVPPSLLSTTIRAALPVALGETSLAGLAGRAAELARSSLQQTLLARCAAVALVTVILAAGGACALWLAQQPAASPAAAEPEALSAEPEALSIGTPRPIASFLEEKHYRGQPVPVAFSADGKRVAVLVKRDTEAGELFLQEIASGAKVGILKIQKGFSTVAADGKALALVYGGDAFSGEVRVEVRDLATLKFVSEWKDDKPRVQPVQAFLAGDRLLLAGGPIDEATIRLFRDGVAPVGPGGGVVVGMAGPTLGLYDLTGKDKPAVHAWDDEDALIAGQLVSPAGKLSALLLLKRGEDEVRLEAIDLSTGKQRKLADRIEATALAATPDGKFVALQTAADTVQLWDAVAGKPGPQLGDGDTTIVCFAFSPDGRILATAGSDRRLTLWDVRTGRVARRVAQPRVQQLLFSADGRLLASASPEEVKIWELGK